MSQTLNDILDLINDLERTKVDNEVYRLLSKYIVKDTKETVLNTLSYEDTFYEKKAN